MMKSSWYKFQRLKSRVDVDSLEHIIIDVSLYEQHQVLNTSNNNLHLIPLPNNMRYDIGASFAHTLQTVLRKAQIRHNKLYTFGAKINLILLL
jgi:hypothetical protein